MKAFTCVTHETSLEIKDKNLIVSGGINQYEIDFIFDDSWIDFEQCAVFSKQGSDVISVPIVGGKCSIPSEILSKDGEFQFGIYGVSKEKSYSSKVYTIKVFMGSMGFL